MRARERVAQGRDDAQAGAAASRAMSARANAWMCPIARASATLAGRRAERLSSSGTSTTTWRATRAASASRAAGSGTCSSTWESTARSYAASSAGTRAPS